MLERIGKISAGSVREKLQPFGACLQHILRLTHTINAEQAVFGNVVSSGLVRLLDPPKRSSTSSPERPLTSEF